MNRAWWLVRGCFFLSLASSFFMYWLYADGLRAFFLTVRFAFGLTVAGLEEPWESAARITRPISSSVNDN